MFKVIFKPHSHEAEDLGTRKGDGMRRGQCPELRVVSQALRRHRAGHFGQHRREDKWCPARRCATDSWRNALTEAFCMACL